VAELRLDVVHVTAVRGARLFRNRNIRGRFPDGIRITAKLESGRQSPAPCPCPAL